MQGIGSWNTKMIVAVIGLLSAFFSLFMSNVAATVLLVSLILIMSESNGLGPIGCCIRIKFFIIPTHQVNAYSMGPGKYKTSGSLKTGLGLTLVFLVITAVIISGFFVKKGGTMNYFFLKQWSPYIVGILIGLLNVGALLVSKKPLGASTSFLKLGGMLYGLFNKKKVEKNEYYQKKTPEVDWGVMLIIGIVIGSFISSITSGDFKVVSTPLMWSIGVSDSFPLRFVASLIGGIFLGVGARWAGGCTSGHGISGTSMLSVISWVATIGFFVGGIASGFLIYGI